MAKRGGFFDFNCDGKESIFEKALAYKMFEECMKEDEQEMDDDDDSFYDHDFHYNDDDYDYDDDDWRDYCDDADEYGLDPYDYDTLEEYEEAKEEIDTDLQYTLGSDPINL